MKLVIDADGGALGRIASYVAKQALLGKEVVVVNCSKIIITGNKPDILQNYKQLRGRGGWALNGPYFPKTPERIMKRTIRGMLPWKNERGVLAFKRVKCYNEVPAEFEEVKKINMKKEVKAKAMSLTALSREL